VQPDVLTLRPSATSSLADALRDSATALVARSVGSEACDCNAVPPGDATARSLDIWKADNATGLDGDAYAQAVLALAGRLIRVRDTYASGLGDVSAGLVLQALTDHCLAAYEAPLWKRQKTRRWAWRWVRLAGHEASAKHLVGQLLSMGRSLSYVPNAEPVVAVPVGGFPSVWVRDLHRLL
jgi:hypothetical protein